MGLQTVDYVRTELACCVDQVLGVFFGDESDLFMYELSSPAGASLDVVGSFGPLLAESVPQRVDAVLAIALASARSVAGSSQRNRAELACRTIGVLKPAVDTQSRSVGVCKLTIHNLK
jgi:hypothetical protein